MAPPPSVDRRLLYLVLTPFLFFQLYLAAKKLCDGQPTTFISYMPVDKNELPSVGFCDAGSMRKLGKNDTFISVYEATKGRNLLTAASYFEETSQE